MKTIHRIKIMRAIAVAGASIVTFAIFIASNADSPLLPSHRMRTSIVSVAPEGWGFFTRDPRESRLHAWELHDDATYVAANPSDLRGFALGGVRRRSRLRGIELGQLMGQVPAGAWTDCRGPIETCPAPETWVVLDNPMHVRTMCGRYVLERKEPVPWAWAGSDRPQYMPAKVAHIDVICPSGDSQT